MDPDNDLQSHLSLTNTTDVTKYFNISAGEEEILLSGGFEEGLSLIIQSVMTFIGFVGNVITFKALKAAQSIFGSTTLKLLKNQAVVDACVCFLGSIYVLQPTMWKTDVSETLNMIICQVSSLFPLIETYFTINHWGTQVF